jgi:hypothetical protein
MQIRNKARAFKNHVYKHRGAYAAGTVFIVWMTCAKRVANGVDEFLESKDIDPMEFWLPEAYEEKQLNNKEQ